MRPGTGEESRALLQAGVGQLRLELPGPALDRMLDYLAELQKWNAAYNLTAIRDPQEMVTRHLLDSLAVLPHLDGTHLLDVGAGAGLPGVPLALAQPGLRVTLLDSGGKKARFLRHVQRQLKLDNVEVVEARAEGYTPPVLFDTVISRAFAALAEFLRGTAKLGAARAHWLAMKGKLDPAELKNIPSEFQIVKIQPLTVPGLNEERHLVVASLLAPRSLRSS